MTRDELKAELQELIAGRRQHLEGGRQLRDVTHRRIASLKRRLGPLTASR